MDVFWLEFAGVLFLIALIGFFSASEVAVLSSRKSRIRELVEAGNRSAMTVASFQSDPDRFLATIHVGIIFSLILASGLAGMLGFAYLEPAFQSSPFAWLREAS